MKRTAIVSWLLLICLMGGLASSASAQLIQSGAFVSEVGGIPQQSDPVDLRSNILVNPGFESGALPPWTTAGWTVISTDAYSGSYSAEGITNIWIRQDIAPTDVTTINAITVWEKQPSGIAFAAVDFIYNGNDSDYDEFLVAPGADWTFIDMTSQLRGAGNLTAIRFYSYSGPYDQTTRIDDVTIDVEGGVPVETSSWGAVKALYR